MRKHGPLFLLSAHSAVGMAAPVALPRIKGGDSLSRKRIPPLNPQEKGYIACLDLEELHTLRNVSAVYMASP